MTEPHRLEFLISGKVNDRNNRIKEKLDKMRIDAFNNFVTMQVELLNKVNNEILDNTVAYHKANCINRTASCELDFITEFLIAFNTQVGNDDTIVAKWQQHYDEMKKKDT